MPSWTVGGTDDLTDYSASGSSAAGDYRTMQQAFGAADIVSRISPNGLSLAVHSCPQPSGVSVNRQVHVGADGVLYATFGVDENEGTSFGFNTADDGAYRSIDDGDSFSKILAVNTSDPPFILAPFFLAANGSVIYFFQRDSNNDVTTWQRKTTTASPSSPGTVITLPSPGGGNRLDPGSMFLAKNADVLLAEYETYNSITPGGGSHIATELYKNVAGVMTIVTPAFETGAADQAFGHFQSWDGVNWIGTYSEGSPSADVFAIWSDDGGDTWTKVASPNQLGFFMALREDGLALCKQGGTNLIFRSDDFGHTWAEASAQPSSVVFDCFVAGGV